MTVSASRGGIRPIPPPMDRSPYLPSGRFPLPDKEACYRALMVVGRYPESANAEEIDHIRYWCVRHGHDANDTKLIETAYRILKRWEPTPCSKFRPHHKGNKKKKCIDCGCPRSQHLDVQAAQLLRLRERLVEAWLCR